MFESHDTQATLRAWREGDNGLMQEGRKDDSTAFKADQKEMTFKTVNTVHESFRNLFWKVKCTQQSSFGQKVRVAGF